MDLNQVFAGLESGLDIPVKTQKMQEKYRKDQDSKGALG